MALPRTITAGELADLDNATAGDVWTAIERGKTRVSWDGLAIVGMNVRRIHNQVQVRLQINDTTYVNVAPAIVLTVETVTA
jgi:hypothetical protein